jgi:hypothetical protein
MSNTKTLNSSSTNSSLYKLQDNASGFTSNSFPIRRLVRSSFDRKIFKLSVLSLRFCFDLKF